MHELQLIKKIESDIQSVIADDQKEPTMLDAKWRSLMDSEPGKFINADKTVNRDGLRNFRRDMVFIPDTPVYSSNPIKKLLSGGHRGERQLLRDVFNVLRNEGLYGDVSRYPVSDVGNPEVWRYKGCRLTLRWMRHIYLTSLLSKHLGSELDGYFTHLDVGSSYGLFSHMLKLRHKSFSSLLVDFPEQLVLAHYYLQRVFPDARIAGFRDVNAADVIDRDFIKQFDFVLVPWFLYEKIAANTIDVFTNFASFGEMKREWLEYYIKKPPFITAKYFLTANRFQSAPTYDTDITVLDYPLRDFTKIEFRISPFFTHTYQRKNIFFYEKVPFSSQYFEFLGKRQFSGSDSFE